MLKTAEVLEYFPVLHLVWCCWIVGFEKGSDFPFFQISGNVCEWREALKIFVKPDTIEEAESFSNLALI